jgi:hypothetical protein
MQLQARRRDIGRLGYAFIVELPEERGRLVIFKDRLPIFIFKQHARAHSFRRRRPDWIVGSG